MMPHYLPFKLAVLRESKLLNGVKLREGLEPELTHEPVLAGEVVFKSCPAMPDVPDVRITVFRITVIFPVP